METCQESSLVRDLERENCGSSTSNNTSDSGVGSMSWGSGRAGEGEGGGKYEITNTETRTKFPDIPVTSNYTDGEQIITTCFLLF